jgi:hypothetical protein
MPTLPSKPIIFISYAPADEPEKPADGEIKWLSFVTEHLRAAEEIGALEIWTEPLAPGADLDPEAQRKLRACDIFAPLVSTHSLAFGTVVSREIAIIRERQSRGESVALFPLMLTPTPDTALDVENLRPPGGQPFSSYDAGERDQQMLDAADEIVEIAADAAARKARRRTSARLSLVPASPGAPRRRTDRRPAQSENTEPESLKDWLTKQVPQVTAAIAARVALRLAACEGRFAPRTWSAEGSSRFLASLGADFRAIALARVVAKYPNHAKDLRATALVAAERAFLAQSGGLILSAAAYAAAAADMVTQDSALAAPFDDPPPFAAAYAAAATTADPSVRTEIGFDASAVQRLGARRLADLPLWWESPPDWWKRDWERLKAVLPHDEDWDVWIDWYEERLRGGSRGEAYELVFASTPQEIWDRGPAAANAWIKAHLPLESGVLSLPNRPKRLPKRA